MRIGPYELREELGRGAMARVWRAWDPTLEREVAVKEPLFDQRLPRETLDEMARRFVVEGRAAARLNHPNIVAVHAIDVWDGRPAIVMELVEGATLSNLLMRGALPVADALSFLDQLLDAVSYAHSQGVVHRDIKPDNIFVTTAGQVKLADFGIAHIEGEGVTRLTVAGSVLGTPGYMSPEQALGKPIDARSDLFSIGVVAYEMLAGESPFAAGSPSTATLLYRIVHEPAPDLQMRVLGVPDHVARAIMAALEKSPDDRPASADAFKRMLRGPVAVGGGNAGTRVTNTATEPDRVFADVSTARAMDGAASAGTSRWLPYVLVASVCIGALVLAFASASMGGGGGAATAAADARMQGKETPDMEEQNESDLGLTENPDDETLRGAEGETDAQGFSQQNPPYTLTVDSDGDLCLLDASGRQLADPDGFYLDVSYLPEKAVARLEQGVVYDTYDEAWAEFSSTDEDCLPYVVPYHKLALNPNRVADEGPYWCIVIDVYPSREEAERVATASSEEFGVEVSVMPTLEWYGLFYEYLNDDRTNLGEGYCVVTGLARDYQSVLQKYLELSEVLGQPVDTQVVEAIASNADNWYLPDKLDEIKYVGTRRYPDQ